jgi:hypothetical protein
MSYLSTPRLTFSGKFQADPSTVNNDPNHFNNATFRPEFQDYNTPGNPGTNGWWNPDGTGNFRLIDCVVTSVTYQDGSTTSNPSDDAIIGMSVMDADGRVAGKIVDLDSQQQGVSEIWGMQVRIVDDGNDLMKGDYKEAAFTNLWFNRSTDIKGGAGKATASYQSVITNIDWNIEQSNSRYLQELKGASKDMLSIQFTVDRYNGDHTSATFTIGRLAGSIGPSSTLEPNHCVLGRQMFPVGSNCNYATALVDDNLKTISMDLSNALQFGMVNGEVEVVENRNLTLTVNTGTVEAPEYSYLGKINYEALGWYMQQSGSCTFNLSKEQLDLVNKYPLAIVDYQASNPNTFILDPTVTAVFNESIEYAIADKFVFRLNPKEQCTVNFYATELGKTVAGKVIEIQQVPGMFAAPSVSPIPGVPASGVQSASKVTTDQYGMATLEITGEDPGNPREFIDGQVYALAYNLEGHSFSNGNTNNFISLLVFDSVEKDKIKHPTWADLKPIMQQYANLYPLMSKGVFNLAKQDVIDNNAKILKFVFSKEKTDPNFMPATRDLSGDKQKMILNYLDGIFGTTNNETTETIA